MRSISPRWLIIGGILLVWAVLSLSAEPRTDTDDRLVTGSESGIGIVE